MKLHSNIYGWEYVWEEFAQEKGGKAVLDKDGQICALVAPVPEHKSTFSLTPTSHGTAGVMHYLPSTNFVMQLFTERLIHRLEKAFGLQDLKVGDQAFDSRFVIQSNAPDSLRTVFQDPELRQTILESSVDEISIIPGSIAKTGNWVVPEGHYLIVCHQDKFVDKYEQINANFHILNCLLQELTACGIVGGAPVKAGAAPEQAQAPAANPGRLHSPLLGR